MSPPEPESRLATSGENAKENFRSRILHRELERRLEFFDKTDESAFGGFTAGDWVICTILFFVLPLVIVWLAV
jgi:hypothetical protein